MYSVEFDYARHRRRDVPLVPISLRSKNSWVEVWAYVDSGAFYSIFDDKVAELLGIEIHEGKRMLAVVGDGSFIPFYVHKMRMRLEEDDFEMELGFSAKLGVGFNLLGMDLFDRYKVTFDNGAKKVIFEKG